jgi:AraC-like DNA-binding protein
MPTSPTGFATINRRWLPRTSLTTCMRAAMSRSTLGVSLSDEQRFNHFPASPLCGITWWFEGVSEFLARGTRATLSAPRTVLRSRIVFSGPHTGPTITWNPAPVHGLMLLLMPDALHRLTGLDIAAWVDRMADIRDVLPDDWITMCERVLILPDDDARVDALQDFLAPLWQRARPASPFQVHRYADWAQALALRAATSGAGRSLRQVERRVKQWAGLPLRELRGVSRAERAFFDSVAAAGEGERPRWSMVAQTSGYSDQSHLCREVRRITGFTPDELYRRVEADESFWSYRVWA